MKDPDTLGLLLDLARLLKKYGPRAFSELASSLREESSVEQLATILEKAALAGKGAKAATKTSRARNEGSGLEELLAEHSSTDPKKAELLSSFVQAYTGRRVLPTLRDVRAFASSNGLKPVLATSRNNALLALVKDLLTYPADKISAMLEHLRKHDNEDDRSLERWAGVILDKERRNR